MQRFTITEGAKTSAGGTVIQASSHGSINGARIALENDRIFCVACGGPGYISCVGPRLVELWNGVPVALENDICICGCTPHPRLIANQTLRSQWIDDTVAAGSAAEMADGAGTAAVDNAGSKVQSFDLDFLITNQITGCPAVDWPYVIELPSGGRLEGRTDYAGKTQKISAMGADDVTLQVYEPDVTPIDPNWDR